MVKASQTTDRFRELLAAAPPDVQIEDAGGVSRLGSRPVPSFAKVQEVLPERPIYSVRINLDWRALCVVRDDVAIWFWIGPHREYERMLRAL